MQIRENILFQRKKEEMIIFLAVFAAKLVDNFHWGYVAENVTIKFGHIIPFLSIISGR